MRFPTVSRRAVVLTAVVVAVILAVITIAGISALSSAVASVGRGSPPRISHEIVMERLRDVARLVASEMTLRDVVIYEQTRLRSTKRALLVVTGKVSAGINLRVAKVEIDSAARRIVVTLPPAQITSVEVLNVTTYDESRGLLNPFTPDDRDVIQRRIRNQLRVAAEQSGILQHADQSARKTLEELLKMEGYTVEIRRPLTLEPVTG
jgi:hypothetical protein